MRLRTLIHCCIAIGVASWTTACGPQVNLYTGPTCLIHLYTLPDLQGAAVPVMRDTAELAAAWRNTAVSAKVILGTWRLFNEPDYKGFMGDYRGPTDVPRLGPPRTVNSLRCIAPEPPPPVRQY